MTQELVNRVAWLAKNPDIIFKPISKAYFGQYLIKVSLRVVGGSRRMYGAPFLGEPNYHPTDKRHIPTQQEFTNWWFDDCVDDAKAEARWVARNPNTPYRDPDIVVHPQLLGNRYIVDTLLWPRTERLKVDTHLLYRLHIARINKEPDIRFSRSQHTTFMYCKTEQRLTEMLNRLQIENDDILEIHYAHPDRVEHLADGKEYSKWADDWKYKVYFKELSEPNEGLYSYLASIEKEGHCLMPYNTIEKIMRVRGVLRTGLRAGQTRFWTVPWGRSHIYINDLDFILLFQMLAPGKYSNYIELVPIDDK